MAWVHLLGRKFAKVLIDPEFTLLEDWPYWNRFGQQGHSYYGFCRHRRFCISQSKSKHSDPLFKLARVFGNGAAIDEKTGPFYRNQSGQIGLVVAAWNGSQWLQMISPGTPDQPRDSFAELAEKIRTDRTIDPQPLQIGRIAGSADSRLKEFDDILRNLLGRKDFKL